MAVKRSTPPRNAWNAPPGTISMELKFASPSTPTARPTTPTQELAPPATPDSESSKTLAFQASSPTHSTSTATSSTVTIASNVPQDTTKEPTASAKKSVPLAAPTILTMEHAHHATQVTKSSSMPVS